MSGFVWAKGLTVSAKALRAFVAALVPSPSGRALGGITGVSPGTDSTIFTVTTSAWTVQPFAGVLDVSAAGDGATPFAFLAAETGGVTGADSSNPRVDLLYVRHDDPDETNDQSKPAAAVIGYLAGTPSASPQIPATPARSMPLAQINVPKLNNGSPTIALIAPFTVAAGGILPVRGVSEYPATPYNGQSVYDLSLGESLRWNGTAWTTGVIAKLLTRSSGTSTIGTGVETTVAGWDQAPYDKGGIGYNAGVFTAPAPGLYSWSMTLGLPGIAAAYIQHVSVLVNGVASQSGEVQYNVPANANAQFVSAGGPLVLAANDTVTLRFQQNSGAAMAVQQVSAALIRRGA